MTFHPSSFGLYHSNFFNSYLYLSLFCTIILALFHVSSRLERIVLLNELYPSMDHHKYLYLLDYPWQCLVSPWTKSLAHTRMRRTLGWSNFTVNQLYTTCSYIATVHSYRNRIIVSPIEQMNRKNDHNSTFQKKMWKCLYHSLSVNIDWQC